jgi:hypothetical protein
MCLIGLPGLKVVAGGQECETGSRRRLANFGEPRHGELLMRKHKSDELVGAKLSRRDFRGGVGGLCKSRRRGSGGKPRPARQDLTATRRGTSR